MSCFAVFQFSCWSIFIGWAFLFFIRAGKPPKRPQEACDSGVNCEPDVEYISEEDPRGRESLRLTTSGHYRGQRGFSIAAWRLGPVDLTLRLGEKWLIVVVSFFDSHIRSSVWRGGEDRFSPQ